MANFFSSLNSQGVYTWTIHGTDGIHTVRVEMGTSIRQPLRLFVDERYVEKIDKVKKMLIPRFEHSFLCGEETLALVIHGNKMDLVHNNHLINSKIEYHPKEHTSYYYMALLVLLNLLSFTLPFFMGGFNVLMPFEIFVSVVMVASSSILSITYATSPFLSKTKKLFYGILPVILCWIVVSLLCTVDFYVDRYV